MARPYLTPSGARDVTYNCGHVLSQSSYVVLLKGERRGSSEGKQFAVFVILPYLAFSTILYYNPFLLLFFNEQGIRGHQ